MTKINIRSPFYLRYDEPDVPSVALDSDLVNLQGMTIDQFGNITLPDLDYGDIQSYTSTASDFNNGKFDTVLTDTVRTVTFSVIIPQNFTNADDDILDIDLTFTQPAFVCTGGVTLNGSIPSQSLDVGGETTEIDLSSFFTQGVDPITGYNITNPNPDLVSTSLTNDSLKIFSINRAGTATIYAEAFDNDTATCNATQSITITISNSVLYDCTYAILTGGGISNTGTITNPSINEGAITAVKDTSGGTPITSYPANNTGSARSVTLYFDITVPSGLGYSNEGSTVECSKTFTQSSVSLPEFDCGEAGLTGQAIALNGTVKIGNANKGTISGFSPLSYPTVITDTERTVAFNITPPASGYANSGGSDISCNVTMIQPAPEFPQAGDVAWYVGGTYRFLTFNECSGSGYDCNRFSLEGQITNSFGRVSPLLTPTRTKTFLDSVNIQDNIGSIVGDFNKNVPPYFLSNIGNEPMYMRISSRREGSTYRTPTYIQQNYYPFYFAKVEPNYRISEIWYANLIIPFGQSLTPQRIA